MPHADITNTDCPIRKGTEFVNAGVPTLGLKTDPPRPVVRVLVLAMPSYSQDSSGLDLGRIRHAELVVEWRVVPRAEEIVRGLLRVMGPAFLRPIPLYPSIFYISDHCGFYSLRLRILVSLQSSKYPLASNTSCKVREESTAHIQQ